MSGNRKTRCPICGGVAECFGLGPYNSAPFKAQCKRGCLAGERGETEEEAWAAFGESVRNHIRNMKQAARERSSHVRYE